MHPEKNYIVDLVVNGKTYSTSGRNFAVNEEALRLTLSELMIFKKTFLRQFISKAIHNYVVKKSQMLTVEIRYKTSF